MYSACSLRSFKLHLNRLQFLPPIIVYSYVVKRSHRSTENEHEVNSHEGSVYPPQANCPFGQQVTHFVRNSLAAICTQLSASGLQYSFATVLLLRVIRTCLLFLSFLIFPFARKKVVDVFGDADRSSLPSKSVEKFRDVILGETSGAASGIEGCSFGFEFGFRLYSV